MSTLASHPETRIMVDDKVPMVRLTREFDAPVAKVFRAHADPEIYARWSGPRRISTTIREWDCRTGGAWRFDQSDPDGHEFGFYGSFHEVRPNELIVQTFTFDGFPDGVALERISFEDIGDGRTRLVATSLVDDFEARDSMIESGMEHGIREGYEKLDEILAATQTA